MSRRSTHGKPLHVLQTPANDGALAKVVRQAERIIGADRVLGQWLDQPIKRHCRVANITEEVLTLEVDSPAWSHRVRFLLPELARHFARRVRLKVRPPLASAHPAALAPTELSDAAATALRELADTLEAGPLKEAVRRLATRRPPRPG